MTRLGKIIYTFLIALSLQGLQNAVEAANRYSINNGNWSNTAIWSATSGGAGGASVPVAGDDVFIQDFTVTVDVNANCANLTIGSAGGAPGFNIGAFTITVSGNMVLIGSRDILVDMTSPSSVLTVGGNLTLGPGGSGRAMTLDMSSGTNNASTLNIAGSMTRNNDGVFTAGTASTVNYNGASPQTVNVSQFNYAHLITNNTDAVTGATLGAAATAANITGNLTVNSGLFRTNNLAMTRANSRTTTVAAGATMNAGTTSILIGTASTVNINGTFVTANTSGFSGTAATAIRSTNTPTITLGANSVIEYNAAAAQTVTNRTDYANVTLTGGSKTIGTAAAQTVTLSKNLTVNSGATYLGSTNNPALNIAGDFSNSGTFTQGSGLVTFNGALQQTILGSATTTFNNITLNNAGGLSITTSPVINGLLTFTSGRIYTGVNKVTLGIAATTAGTGAGKYISGNEEILIPNAVTPSATFIIGDAADYTPVTISFAGTTSGSGSLTAFTTAGDHTDILNSGINSSLSVNRTWSISNSGVGGFTSYSGTFTFVGTDIDGGATTANFVVRKLDGTWATTNLVAANPLSTQASGMTTFGVCQVGEARTITVATNPSSTSICASIGTSFSSTSTSIPTPTIKWQRGNPGYTDISAGLDAPSTTYGGFTTSTLTLTGSDTPINGYLYRAVFTNINGTVNSTPATLTVNASPDITAQPSNQSVCTSVNAIFSVTTSAGSPTYQWEMSSDNSVWVNTTNGVPAGVTYSNATTANLTVNGTSAVALYYYRCKVTAAGCYRYSNSATLTINTVPPAGSVSGTSIVCLGQTGVAYSTAIIPGATSYTWSYSGSGFSIASGAGTNSITADFSGAATAGNLTVTGVNACGNGPASANFPISTVASSPAAAGPISGTTPVCQGQNGVPYVVGIISGASSYSWVYSGTGFSIASGAGTNAITANFTPTATSGNLTVSGVNGCGSGASSSYSISLTPAGNVPAAAGTITGTAAVCRTAIYTYSVPTISGATSYLWSYSGTGFTSSGNTSSISGSFSSSSTSGNLTVQGVNGCGLGTASPAYAITVSTCAPHNSCNGCHMTHNAAGGAINVVAGNPNLCMSCHNATGMAAAKPFTNSDKAIPGVSGTSHAWDKPSVNPIRETNKTTNSEMLMRLPGDSIICSTCHNQHNGPATFQPYFLRASNAGNALCKDCHSARNKQRYNDNPTNTGSHPVGVVYPGGTDPRFKTTPDAPLNLISSNVECLTCHKQHFAPTSNGYILRSVTNDYTICTSCHILQEPRRSLIHKGFTCRTCHQPHNTNKANILLIRDTIDTPNSGLKPVVFTANASASNYADGAAPFDGICEVCHTATDHYRNDSPQTADARHVPAPQKCVNCHPHNNAFYPQARCFDCHNTPQDFPGIGPVGGRRQIVDSNGDGTGTGGDFKRTSHHVNGAIPNESDCILCHYMGDHKRGEVKLLDPDDGYNVIYTYDPLNKSSVENFCLNCHDANGAGGDVTPFSDNVTVPIRDGAMWANSAHKTNPLTCLDCHAGGHGSNKRNNLGPFDKIADASADPMDEEEEFCLNCHGAGGIAAVKVHLAFSGNTNTTTAFFKHDPANTFRVHDKNENTGPSFSGANRHIECVDCHNPHGVIAGVASAPTLPPALTGAKGVDPSYAGPGAPAGFTWQNSVTYEYQVCFKCHSSFTTLSSYLPDGVSNGTTPTYVADGLKKITTGGTNGQIADSRDMAQEFNPANNSFHPVMAAGKNLNINANTFQAGYSFTSRIYCVSCHNNSESATAGEGRGPHGSKNLHILDRGTGGNAQYKTVHNEGATSPQTQLCTKCHQASRYWQDNPGSRFMSGGNAAHWTHMVDRASAECYVCHDTHGSEQFHNININRNEATCVTAVTTNTQAAFVHAAGTAANQCNLTCHGINMSGNPYNPDY